VCLLAASAMGDCAGCRTHYDCTCPTDPFGCYFNPFGTSCKSDTGCYNCCNAETNQGSLNSVGSACVCNTGFSGDQCEITSTPAPTCLPLSSGSCHGTTGGWNPSACMSISGDQYCCCGGEGYFCKDELDCPSPAPVPSPATPEPTPDPATPEPTPPLTSAPTPPSRCTEANTCEVESSSECKTCYTGSSSNSLCQSYNVNYESWYCTWCDCSTESPSPASPTTPAPAPSLPSGTFTNDCTGTSTTTSSCKQTLAFGTGLQWDASEPVTMTMEFTSNSGDHCTSTFYYYAEAMEPDQVTLTETNLCSVSGSDTCSCSDAGVNFALMTFSLSGDGTSLSLTKTTNGVPATTQWHKDADNGGGSSFPYLYVGVAAAGVIAVILIFVSVWWFRSRKVEIDGVDSAPLVENDQMTIESTEPYHEFSGDETTC